ncbi:hypothetical protein TeGR_g2584 [Tetraparma gracilis]|uniref:Uncharacterized protein n=1 Tax=Tetraparma gracilis TaxID=2962635 RepID=A0ABQ6MAL3_9STRA|nr:hypothetical protein TeGR_g2584 [Tetraparma gracilis]
MATVSDEPQQINLAATPDETPLPGGLPPLSSLKDEYSELTKEWQSSWLSSTGGVKKNVYGTKLPYFDADELAKLSSQPPPVDHFLAGCNGQVPVPPGERRVVPIVEVPKDVEAAPGSQPPSLAEAVYGYRTGSATSGVSSCDELLHEDSSGGEIMKFLNTFNSKPLWALRVYGSHEEGSGKHRSTVVDFDYKVDISHFISPFGYITTDNDVTVEETIQDFLKDSNALKNTLKSMFMYKEVDFDLEHLQRMVHGYVRSLGWTKYLLVELTIGNHATVVFKKNFTDRVCVSAKEGERGRKKAARLPR